MKQSRRQFHGLRHNHSAHAALTGLVLFTIAMIAPPIQAQEEPPESEQIGYWSFDRYELNGTSSSTTESPSTWQWQTPQYESGYGILERARGYAPSAGSQAHISLSGAMSAVFKWYPADWDDYNTWYYYYAGYLQPKGDKLSALERADARTFEVKYNNTNHVVENSLGTGVRDTGNWEGESFANSTTPQNQTIPQSSEPYVPAGRIVSQTLLPGQTEVFIPAQFHVDASSDQSTSGSIFFQATKDERSVQISRSGAPAPKHQGAPNITINLEQDEWVEFDGTGHGHSVYSHDYKACVPASDCLLTMWDTRLNNQQFAAALNGSWSNNLTWQWTPSESSDTRTSHSQDMPIGTPKKPYVLSDRWDGNPTGQSQKVITYDVTDNADGAVGKARYYLTLHDEFEVANINTPQEQSQEVDDSPYLYRTFDHPVAQSNQTSESHDYEYSITTSSTLEATSSLGFKGEFPVFKAKGLTFTSVEYGTDFSASVKVEASFPVKPAVTLEPGMAAHPVVKVFSHHRKFWMNQYNPSGFVGKQLVTTDTFNDVTASNGVTMAPVMPLWSEPYPIPGIGSGSG